MQISLSDTGKRFNRDWIFRGFSFQFTQGNSYAITGPNGSGKSTLLQIIGGAIAASEGKIEYSNGSEKIEGDDFYRYISVAAPYQELIEEMTLVEFLEFHRRFKPFFEGIRTESVVETLGLAAARDKQIRYFSSGMKQRVKLAQAFLSDSDVLLLDEPCTNLDEEGIMLYHKLVSSHSPNRIVIVSSNDRQEYGFCKESIYMPDISRPQANPGAPLKK